LSLFCCTSDRGGFDLSNTAAFDLTGRGRNAVANGTNRSSDRAVNRVVSLNHAFTGTSKRLRSTGAPTALNSLTPDSLTDTTNTATDQTEADIGSGVEQNVQREPASSLARLLREVIALVSRKSIDGRSEFAAVVHLVRLAAKNVRNRLLIVASAEVRQNPDRVNSVRKVKSSAYSVAT